MANRNEGSIESKSKCTNVKIKLLVLDAIYDAVYLAASLNEYKAIYMLFI